MKPYAYVILPLAAALAACGDKVDDTATTDPIPAQPVTPIEAAPQPTATPLENMTPDQLDDSAEADEEAADRIEDTNPAAADRLEESAEAKQEARDEQR